MKFIDWVLKFFNLKTAPLYTEPVTSFPVARPYTDMCLSLMRHFDSLQADGEWKAHNVYARLQKKFPKVDKHTLRLEIELCYHEHFKK